MRIGAPRLATYLRRSTAGSPKVSVLQCSKKPKLCLINSAAKELARLQRHQGKRNEARELLAPGYGWFTEGFDTLRSERG